MKLDSNREWSYEGYFLDCDKKRVKTYDDVRLLASTTAVESGTVSVDEIFKDTFGTVLLHSDGDPALLEIECYIQDGMAFAINYPADQVLLVRTAEEKRQQC